MKKIIYLLIMLLPFVAFSQEQVPSSTKWMQIDAISVRVIYPQEIEEEAQRIVNIVNMFYEFETKTMKTKPKKLQIILLNQTTVPNGFAALRPRRSVWYTTPSQFAADLGTSDWLTLLAAHEYRHIVQYSKINKNFTKVLSILWGETGRLVGEFSIPSWFFEGDAVCTETAFSNSGRGRIPKFTMPIRTMLLNDVKYKYDKAKFRSYKDFYPNHYPLGYMLTSYARVKYSPEVWSDVLHRSSLFPICPMSFSWSMKRVTGKTERKLYDDAMHYYDSLWRKDNETRKFSEALLVNKAEKKLYTNYTEVAQLETGRFIVRKDNFTDVPAFYLIQPNGDEEKLINTDAEMTSFAQNKIVWAREISDPRWEYRNYSDIMVLTIEEIVKKQKEKKSRRAKVEKTKYKYKVKEKRLTKNQKYFAPSLSPDGNKIAVVEFTSDLKSSIVILDAESGTVIKRFSLELNEFIRTPTWAEDNKTIAFTHSLYRGVAMSILNTDNGKITEIIPHTSENIGRPVFYKNYVLYNSNFDGIGNINAVDTKTFRRFKVTSRKYGAYNPRIYAGKLFFEDYSVKGYNIASMELAPENWQNITNSKYKYEYKVADKLTKQEQGINLFNPDLVPKNVFETKKYRGFLHAVNIHSWGIELSNISTVNFYLYSANVLNNTFGIVGTNYNINEQTFMSEGIFRYSKFYPVIDFGGSYGDRTNNYTVLNQETNVNDTIFDRWTEKKAYVNIEVPLRFTRGIYTRGLKFGARYSYTDLDNKEENLRYINQTGNSAFSSLTYSLWAYNLRRQAVRDLNSKFGQFAYLTYSHTPLSNDYVGSQFSAMGIFFFPGIWKNHSTKIKLGFEQQREFNAENSPNYYWFSVKQSFPRGHDFVSFDKLIGANFDYDFPIWYPDFGLGSIIYFSRLRGKVFYDFADVKQLGNTNSTMFQSAGLEMHLQFRVLRLNFPIEVGGRVSYLFNQDNDVIPELLIFGASF